MIRTVRNCIVAWLLIAAPTLADDTVLMDAKIAQAILGKHCAECHNTEERESGIRVDHLDGTFPDDRLKLWDAIAAQIESGSMPPEEETPIPASQQQRLIEWIRQSLIAARSRPAPRNGSIRRLTIAQYRNTLRDLLGLEEDMTDVLPADGVSKHGFTNQPQSLSLSPILLEAYFDIAQRALDACIAGPKSPPIQSFEMRLGKGINPDPIPKTLILGANSHLLDNRDFVVEQVIPKKTFHFEPLAMRTKWRFNEGYQGNATVRGWREYDSIYHAVYACMRGERGYPRGRAYTIADEGLLLRPAIPNNGLFKIDSTYGPQANFKVTVRELPRQGLFRVTVTAAKYRDGLLIDETMQAAEPNESTVTIDSSARDIKLAEPGIYQVAVIPSDRESKEKKAKRPPTLQLMLGDRVFSGVLDRPAFLVARFAAGSHKVEASLSDNQTIERMEFTPLPNAQSLASRFEAFEHRSPLLGVHLGLRRDCGTTMSPVGGKHVVSDYEPQSFTFEGAINNFPSPDVQSDNDNYLAGLRDLGIRSEYTDGRDRPRLLVQSVRFEGPYFETWPPKKHQNLFSVEGIDETHDEQHAKELIEAFATRAYRRPITAGELQSLMNVWSDSWDEHGNFSQSVQDAFLVVLTSPQFLFLIERSPSPEPEPLNPYELASKLSYFIWNSPPDGQTLHLASRHQLASSLDAEIDRMIEDPRFHRFINEFSSQWLSLDKLDVVETDRKAYPELTRDVKRELRKEPAAFLTYLIQQNLPAHNLVRSNLLIANEVVASYYGLGDQIESGFDFVPLEKCDSRMGGLLTQSAILAGLSDGRESNPVKRGAWLARKIIDEPPADPPPNVPSLEEDVSGLSLRERLERHRNQKGCANCHRGIDPWGMPFEELDAGGRWKPKGDFDARATLPDETEITGMDGLKKYLAEDRIDQVAFSLIKHLTIYAIGRDLSYNEIERLRKECLELKPTGYRLRDIVHFVVKSDPFMTK